MGFNKNIRSSSRPHLRDYTRLWLNNFDQRVNVSENYVQLQMTSWTIVYVTFSFTLLNHQATYQRKVTLHLP